MKYLSYSIAWICIVLLIAFGFYGSYEISKNRQMKSTQEKDNIESTIDSKLNQKREVQAVAGDGKMSYLLKAKDGYVYVYQADGLTLYEATGIDLSTLPSEMQEEIAAGKYIESSATLYSFLENYSS